MIVRTACTVNGCPRGAAIGVAKREGSGSPVDDVQAQVSDFSDAQTPVL
jgi:hypothetical protein